MGTLSTTDFNLPGQTALYHGKVRDVYTINQAKLVSVATDRISAFDVVLPRQIPFKGQVLNQLAAHFLKASENVIPNWLRAVPDPNVSIGLKVEPFKVEMVIRGCLVGHAWREYQDGKREICGEKLPDGLNEFDRLAEPIITPTTKAEAGHDEDISGTEIVRSGLIGKEDWQKLTDYTKDLFKLGQAMAAERGLFLADTKYEFGKINEQIILIDEVHTPDSSRYFYEDSYEAYTAGHSIDKPKHLSKEFVREWLIAQDYMGQTGQTMPELDDNFINDTSARYIELYEKLTGQAFIKADTSDILKRIEDSINEYLNQEAT